MSICGKTRTMYSTGSITFKIKKRLSLQTNHVDCTLKRRENGRFHVVSTLNPRGVLAGFCHPIRYKRIINFDNRGNTRRSHFFFAKSLIYIDYHKIRTINNEILQKISFVPQQRSMEEETTINYFDSPWAVMMMRKYANQSAHLFYQNWEISLAKRIQAFTVTTDQEF